MLVYANERENDGVDLFYFILFYFFKIFFASKEAYPIVRRFKKNNVEKNTSKSSKMLEKQILGP